METLDDVLAHYGIRGMKWGVRRKRGPSGTVSSNPEVSSDAAKAHDYHNRAKTVGTHNLSNQELQHLVNRLNLEQQYTRLTTQPKSESKIKKGHHFLKTALSMGKTVNEAISFANSPIGKELQKQIAAAKTKKS